MLINVDAYTAGFQDRLTMPFTDVSGGIRIAKIDGLDPVKATIVSSSFVDLDGSQFETARRESRDIVLSLDLDPEYQYMSVSDIRRRLYQIFMPKNEILLIFQDDTGAQFQINGIVETFASDIFTKDPNVAVGIMCPDPNFFQPGDIQFSITSSSSDVDNVIHYDGDIPAGMFFTATANVASSSFTIYQNLPGGLTGAFDFSLDLEAGDYVDVTTTPGAKSIVVNRGGVDSSGLNGLSPYAAWTMLYPGDNHIRVYSPTGGSVTVDFTYQLFFGGL